MKKQPRIPLALASRLLVDGEIAEGRLIEGLLDGRMEAALFRDTPGLGPLVSTVFSPLTKLLE